MAGPAHRRAGDALLNAASRGRGARPSTRLPAARHPPLGRCLYCLATRGPLTEEHLVPRALGGRLTLRDAVCEPCRRATGRLEQLTLDREFAVPKTLLAFKRRRARAPGPARLPAVRLEGEAEAAIALTPDTFPRGFALPAFEPAGRLAGIDRAGVVPRVAFVPCTLNLGTPARHAVAAPPSLPDPPAYAWSIAKWAYALAVAERGLDGFDGRALRDLLLGRRDDVFNFVGTPEPRAAAATTWLHHADLHEHGGALVLRLALFASAGMTPYEVVIDDAFRPAAAAGVESAP